MAALPLGLWLFIGATGVLLVFKALYGLSMAVVLPVTGGALYVSTARKRVAAVLDAIELKPGTMLVDLGCGDGRVLRAAVRRHAVRAEGYELNPLAYAKARLLSLGCSRITLHCRNFWKLE